jgi:hypothetical protein
MAVTNRGKSLLLSYAFWNQAPQSIVAPTTYYVALCTNAIPPTVDTNVLGDLSEIVAGNGYSAGGTAITASGTGFNILTENDSLDTSEVQLQDVVFTASGGNLPLSGSGARWAALLTNEGIAANRQVIAYWDLVSDRTISTGQTLTLQDATIRLTE